MMMITQEMMITEYMMRICNNIIVNMYYTIYYDHEDYIIYDDDDDCSIDDDVDDYTRDDDDDYRIYDANL